MATGLTRPSRGVTRQGSVRSGGGVDLLERAVGNTPLVRLRRLPASEGAEVWVKLESANPGGSVKDRAALSIVQAAEAEGLLGPVATGVSGGSAVEGATGSLDEDVGDREAPAGARTLLDASSGNTGIAYAMLCARRGYDCEICMPANASEERKALLRAYGATLVITDPADGSEGAIREARGRAEAHPERYFYADQYNNPANPRAHYEGTGPEIWRQTGGRVTHFVAILGTSGTFGGVGRRLREENPDVRLVAVQPDSPFHGIEGAKHMATATVPGIYAPDLADEVLEVRTEEAQAMARRLGREEGLVAGPSGGANVVAALHVAAELEPDGLVVTLLPDGGERYLSDAWLRRSKRDEEGPEPVDRGPAKESER